MPSSDGRGTHHVRRPGAIRALALAALLGAVPLAAPLAPALAQDDPATQRGVPAEATAANAVLARERAIANAQRLAYQRYAAATGANPGASAAQIESLVTSMVVESERSTLNGYSGRYTIRFRGAGSSSAGVAVGGGGNAGGGTAPGLAPPQPPASLPPGTPPILPLAAYLDAATGFRSMEEWLALRRRLLAQPSVGSVEVLAISVEGARLRIGLRGTPASAAGELASGGIVLAPAATGANGMPAPGNAPGWRVGLAGGA